MKTEVHVENLRLLLSSVKAMCYAVEIKLQNGVFPGKFEVPTY